MTYTLADFEVQKGDWVKRVLPPSGLTEWFEYGNRTDIYLGNEILAVLRPSIIIGEKLDEILNRLENYKITDPAITGTNESAVFKIVQPRKPKDEPRKSLHEQVGMRPDGLIDEKYPNIKLICDRIEEIEKKLEELGKKNL